MKDRMLDDQNLSISHVKSQLKAKDEDVLRLEERHAQKVQRMDDRVAQANEEAER